MQNRKKLTFALAVLFITNIALILVMKSLPDARAETYRQGSTGDTVRQIQVKLKNWGYYSGMIDGVYGAKTTEAVKFFQGKNGLKADGMCGIRTQQAMGIFVSPENVAGNQRRNDIELLARLISAEARDQPYGAQVAVGAAVLNRVRHPAFPNSLSGVIFQPGAFAGTGDGSFSRDATESSRRAARDAINGADPGYGAIYYFDPSKTSDGWLWSRTQVANIGSLRFCK